LRFCSETAPFLGENKLRIFNIVFAILAHASSLNWLYNFATKCNSYRYRPGLQMPEDDLKKKTK